MLDEDRECLWLLDDDPTRHPTIQQIIQQIHPTNPSNKRQKLDRLTNPHPTVNQMPKITPLQGEQLSLDELLPDAKQTPHKSVKKVLKKQALYRVRKA